MIFNKEKRIEYLGFNDTWFFIIGTLLVSLLIDFILNNSFYNEPLKYAFLSWSISLIFTIINWTIIRTILIFLRKKFPEFNQVGIRITLFVIGIVSSIVIVDAIGNQVIKAIFGDSYNAINKSRLLAPVIVITMMIMAIYESVYHFVRLKKAIQDEEATKQAIVQSKLDALNNQAKPHFLFNSLNTLRDIIDQDSKEDAKAFVDKLSGVYRYILESDNNRLISLREEIKFAESYLHIQKERFGENLNVEWNIEITQLEKMVVPLSLQLLLENAIKHNIISKAKSLQIKIKTEQEQLVVVNNFQPKTTKVSSTGLGLNNIKKRYGLITDKEVDVQERKAQFIVSIPLLSSSSLNIEHAHSNY